jgi:hypothetical protein
MNPMKLKMQPTIHFQKKLQVYFTVRAIKSAIKDCNEKESAVSLIKKLISRHAFVES